MLPALSSRHLGVSTFPSLAPRVSLLYGGEGRGLKTRVLPLNPGTPNLRLRPCAPPQRRGPSARAHLPAVRPGRADRPAGARGAAQALLARRPNAARTRRKSSLRGRSRIAAQGPGVPQPQPRGARPRRRAERTPAAGGAVGAAWVPAPSAPPAARQVQL